MRFSAAANHSSLKERTLEPRGAEMRSICESAEILRARGIAEGGASYLYTAI
jgi:hypothetical protein